MKGKLKRRWPLNEAQICVKKNQKIKLESLSNLLKSQLNVEKFNIVETEKESGLEQLLELKELGLPVKPTLELERKKIGPKAKQHMGKLVNVFSETNPQEIITSIQKDGKYDFKIDNEIDNFPEIIYSYKKINTFPNLLEDKYDVNIKNVIYKIKKINDKNLWKVFDYTFFEKNAKVFSKGVDP